MVMPIADAVLQQLICTGMADYLDDSGTIDTQDEESGESKRQSENGGYSCIMFIITFVKIFYLILLFFHRQRGKPKIKQ